jgi:hypothetical protein
MTRRNHDGCTVRGTNRRMEPKKWQYKRDSVVGLEELDSKLLHWGNLGWELAGIIQTAGDEDNENILGPETWVLVLKQAL